MVAALEELRYKRVVIDPELSVAQIIAMNERQNKQKDCSKLVIYQLILACDINILQTVMSKFGIP